VTSSVTVLLALMGKIGVNDKIWIENVKTVDHEEIST